MQRLLYQVHRWAGVVLAVFIFTWFLSGLVILYAPPSSHGAAAQLERAEPLVPEPGWLALGEAWARAAKPGADAPAPVAARLVRQAGEPVWIVEDQTGARQSLSAVDGHRRALGVDDALRVARSWLSSEGEVLATAPLKHLDTGPQDSAVRNQEALAPFHRIAVGDGGRELLISVRTGEVVRDSTPLARASYWAGNWLHLLRPVDLLGVKDLRRDTLMWLVFFAFAACVTGLIIGWQRWRPSFGRKAPYRGGRAHPYRDVWNTWHFWAGLIGGTAALLWTLSGWFNGNPFQVFSAANLNRAELARYAGGPLPRAALDWRPAALAGDEAQRPFVELALHRLGSQTALVATDRSGRRVSQRAEGTVSEFAPQSMRAAVARVNREAVSGPLTRLTTYDSYYYARHGQTAVERPLPVLRIDVNDAQGTRYYVDPQDGRLLLRSDQSRRVYRWVWSALHHWDFGWLSEGWLRQAWMLGLVALGLVLASTSLVLGWKRLRKTVRVRASGQVPDAADGSAAVGVNPGPAGRMVAP